MHDDPTTAALSEEGSAGPPARRVAAWLFLVTCLVHGGLLTWGIPSATAPDRVHPHAVDEILPLGALAEMHNTFVESKPDRNYAYPWLHYFLAAGAQAPALLWLAATDGLETPEPAFPYGLRDPPRGVWLLMVSGRLLSLAMAAGTVSCVYLFGRSLAGHAVGLLSALGTLSGHAFAYYARTGNLDGPAFFWTALGLVLFARSLRRGFEPRRAAWLGASAALAMATKDQAVVVFLPVGLYLLFRPELGRGRHGRACLAGLGTALLVYVVATGMLVDPARHLEHVRRLFLDPERLTAADLYFPPLERDAAGIALLAGQSLRALARTTGPVALVVACFGLVRARGLGGLRVVLVLPFGVHFLLLVLPMGHAVARYLLPYSMLVDFFCAVALVSLRRRPTLFALAVLAVLLSRLLWTADLAYAQTFETRDAAGAFLAEHVRPGERVEYFGHPQKLPPLATEVASGRVLDPVLDSAAGSWEGRFDHGPAALDYLEEAGPEFLLVIPDWTSGPDRERSQDCPAEVYEALLAGRTDYVLVAHHEPALLLRGLLARPPFDYPSVAPPVRVFARAEVARERGLSALSAAP